MDKEMKMQCIGGWAFLLLALAIFMLVPASILMGAFAADSDWSAEQIVAVVLFSCALLFLLMGVVMTAYWCKVTRNMEEKDPEADTKTNGQTNGHTNGTHQKPEANGAASKYESTAEEEKEEEGPERRDSSLPPINPKPVVA